jgi:hypothetical protein
MAKRMKFIAPLKIVFSVNEGLPPALTGRDEPPIKTGLADEIRAPVE